MMESGSISAVLKRKTGRNSGVTRRDACRASHLARSIKEQLT
jgi:hypothetical protein